MGARVLPVSVLSGRVLGLGAAALVLCAVLMAAASRYNESIPAGMALPAAALTPMAASPEAPLPESAALTTPVAAAMRTAEKTRAAAPKPR